MIPKNDLIDIFRKEIGTTLRVMEAFPAAETDFKPHERSGDAMKLMKTFVFEMYLNETYLFDEKIDNERYKTYAPESKEAVIADFKKEADDCLSKLEALPEEKLADTVEFAGTSFSKDRFLMMMIHDQVHHRGQLTVYVRMAGGQVPSIYGPSADDPSTNL